MTSNGSADGVAEIRKTTGPLVVADAGLQRPPPDDPDGPPDSHALKRGRMPAAARGRR